MRDDVLRNDYFVSFSQQKYEKAFEERAVEVLSFQRKENAQQRRKVSEM